MTGRPDRFENLPSLPYKNIILLQPLHQKVKIMDYFEYHNGILHGEGVDLRSVANEFGTPCYVYSQATIERHWHAFNDAFFNVPHLICYAVKANSNLSILRLLAKLGSGFDIVSLGELERVLKAGGQANKVVFSGVGKTTKEIRRALDVGILCFNVESESELLRINKIAGEMGKTAPITLRVNPDVDAKTHPYISTGLKENKFGIDIDVAFETYQKAAQLPHVKIVGIGSHIGSQLTEIKPYTDALKRVMVLVERLNAVGISLKYINVGGGLGVRYQDETPPEPEAYVKALRDVLGDAPYHIILEPGRAIVANAGVLITKIEYLKHTNHKHFAIVDSGMHDLIRPALYGAWQNILTVEQRDNSNALTYDVVGPICETSDFLGKDRQLAIKEGDLLVVRSSGAYGATMSSNYNTRCRAAEVLIEGETARLIRRRETIDDLLALEV